MLPQKIKRLTADQLCVQHTQNQTPSPNTPRKSTRNKSRGLTCFEPEVDISPIRQKMLKRANKNFQKESQQFAQQGFRHLENMIEARKKIRFDQDSNQIHLYARWIDPDHQEEDYQVDEEFLPDK